jgi:hypothetical protein
MEQADRHRAGQKANRTGKRNQPQIMLVAEAIQDLVHDGPLYGVPFQPEPCTLELTALRGRQAW